METETISELDQFTQSLKGLEKVCRFSGPAQLFWQVFLESMASVAGARLGVLAGRSKEEASRWKKVAVWPGTALSDASARPFLTGLESATSSCVENGYALAGLPSRAGRDVRDFLLAVCLDSEQKQETYIAAFLVVAVSEASAEESLRRLQLAAHTQTIYHWRRVADQAQASVSQFASVLDLLVLLNAKQRFLETAMTLCNEAAARLKCDRVSLGWLAKDYVRVQAISHMEWFDKKMEAVQSLELAMEESLDQDEVITLPPSEPNAVVTRDHEAFAREQGAKFMCSAPVRLDGQVIGVLSCERSSENFSEAEARALVLYSDMSARRLSDLKRRDRWFGARLAIWTKETLSKLVGVEHTGAKILALLGMIAVGVLFFGKMTYRVEAPFILRTDDIGFLSAPFNGYIDSVRLQIGDEVKLKETLLGLDTRDLLLQETSALSDLTKFQRESEKARAAKALADMRIADAQAEQARAQLELIRYRLQQAAIKAPFDGVIIEGDLKKRIGAPVQQGDLLFKIARIDQIYVECDVSERDVHELRNDTTGEIAFASQPKLKFPIRLTRIEPAAQAKPQGNIFIVRCVPQNAVEPWWRPGMSGVAKLNVERRTFIWIITHRTIDFLRMYLWL